MHIRVHPRARTAGRTRPERLARTESPGSAGAFCFSYGGAKEDRTPDLVIANDALSQLSYGPTDGADRVGVASRCT